MVLSAVSNNGSTKLTGTNKSSHYNNASSAVVLSKAESRDPESDDDDASDDDAYNEFLSFLSTPPGSTNVTPELNEKKELVVEKKKERKIGVDLTSCTGKTERQKSPVSKVSDTETEAEKSV